MEYSRFWWSIHAFSKKESDTSSHLTQGGGAGGECVGTIGMNQ